MDTAPDLSCVSTCLCLASRRLARNMTRLYDRHLRPHGLRATQFSILGVLSRMGPRPMQTLARVLGMERTTLTRSIALMEQQGWVAIARSEDARERPVGLTEAGRRRLEEAFPAWSAAQAEAEEKLGSVDRSLFRAFSSGG